MLNFIKSALIETKGYLGRSHYDYQEDGDYDDATENLSSLCIKFRVVNKLGLKSFLDDLSEIRQLLDAQPRLQIMFKVKPDYEDMKLLRKWFGNQRLEMCFAQ